MKEVTKSIPKLDSMGLILGKPAYTDDIADKDSLIVKVLRSPHPFARIKSIDTSEALKIEGVECVLTYKDVPRNIVTRAGQGYPEPSPYDKYILDEYVRYIGDEVAVVAAVDENTAMLALKEIKVSYEVYEPVLDFEKAEGNKSVIHMEKDAHPMFDIGYDAKNNIAASYEMQVGDVEEELLKSEVTVDETYYTQSQNHAAFEPHCCASYIDFHGRLNIISSTQTPFHVRRIVSHAFSIPTSDIRVIKPRIGGGYGGKQAVHGELLVSAITLKTGKKCKLIFTRKEVFESSYRRHQMRINVRIGANRDGIINAIDMRVLSNTGAYGEHALTVFMIVGSKVLPLYNKVKAVKFGGKVVYTNTTPSGAFRGYGAIQGNFAVESAIDEIAHKINIDPVKLRKLNMIKEGETSPIFKIMGEGREGIEMNIESCRLDYCVERGMKLIGYNNISNGEPKIKNGKARGKGCAIAMQGSGIAYVDMASAILKLNDGGFFNLLIGATDIGTGSDTILAQIAAETMGVDTGDIKVYSSDTDLTPFDTGAYASSTTFVSGNAVKDAALKMKNEIIREGARALNLTPDEVTFEDKTIKAIRNPGNSITLRDLSTLLYYSKNQKQLAVCGSYVGKKSPPPYLAAFCEVEVDIETGKFDLLSYDAVADIGTAINPNLARIQVEGGIVQGIGMAMYEDVKYAQNGSLLTNTFMNYKIPTRMDINKINVELADSSDPAGPYGAKSVGEIGIDTPLAAIANAVYNATGVRIRSLPITPEKVYMGLCELRK